MQFARTCALTLAELNLLYIWYTSGIICLVYICSTLKPSVTSSPSACHCDEVMILMNAWFVDSTRYHMKLYE